MTKKNYPNNGQTVELPPPNTKRWVKSRKLAVIKAIQSGIITEEKACERYELSVEELQSWKRLVTNYGPDALRTTHIKQYRAQDTKSQNFYMIPDDAENHTHSHTKSV